MDELSLAVVGLDFPNPDKSKSNRRSEMALCAPGEPVTLVPEPKNKADRNAVAVFSMRGIQLGYLTAERCGWIGQRLALGEDHAAIFQTDQAAAAIIRIRFGGGAPTLPPVTRSHRSQHGREDDEPPFYPDPDYGDWAA